MIGTSDLPLIGDVIAELNSLGESSLSIASKIDLFEGEFVGGADPALLMKIRKRLSEELLVPLDSVRIAGLARFGISLKHGSLFKPGIADLDIAITDINSSKKCFESSKSATSNFRMVHGFRALHNPGSRTAYQTKQRFADYCKLGMIYPDYMPACEIKEVIMAACSSVLRDNAQQFSDISIISYNGNKAFHGALAKRIEIYVSRFINSVSQDKIPGWSSPVDDVLKVDFKSARPICISEAAWSALVKVSTRVRVVAALVVPLGDEVDSTKNDILVIFDSSSSEDLSELWRISGFLSRSGIFIRFVPDSLSLAALINVVGSYSLTLMRELGERVGRRVLIESISKM